MGLFDDAPMEAQPAQQNIFADAPFDIPSENVPRMRYVQQGEAAPPQEGPGFLEAVGTGLERGVSGAAETGEALVNRLRGAPPAEPSELTGRTEEIEAIKPSEAVMSPWQKGVPWAGYMLGRMAPSVAGAALAGPSLLGVMGGGALGEFLAAQGPRFREQLEAGVPEDQAWRNALKSAGVTGAATGASFGVPLGLVKQLLAQPSIATAEAMIQNYLAGRPLAEGVEEAAIAGGLGLVPTAATHYMATRGRRAAAAPEAPVTEEHPTPEAPRPPTEPQTLPEAVSEAGAPKAAPETPPAVAPTRPPTAPDLFNDYIMGVERLPEEMAPPIEPTAPPAEPPAAPPARTVSPTGPDLFPEPQPIRGAAPRIAPRVEPRAPEARVPEERAAPERRAPEELERLPEDNIFFDIPVEEPPPIEEPVPPARQLDLPEAPPARAAEPEVAAPAEPSPPIAAPPAAAAGPPPRSLAQFIRDIGGIDPRDANIADVRSVLGGRVSPLIRKGGRPLDKVREAAVEAGYIEDPGFRGAGEQTSTITTLLDALDKDLRARAAKDEANRVYPAGELGRVRAPDERSQAIETQAGAIREAFEREGIGGEVDTEILYRAADILERGEIRDPFDAYERAVMEYQDAIQREGARGAGAAPGEVGEPRAGSRAEKAVVVGGEARQGFGAARRAARKEVSAADLAHLNDLFSEKIGQRVDAQDSVRLHTALDELDLSGLSAIPAASARFLINRLRRIVGDTPVHFINGPDLTRYVEAELKTTLRPGGVYGGMWTKDEAGRSLILMNADAMRARPQKTSHVLLHEAMHAAGFEGLDRSSKARAAMRLLMDEVRKSIRNADDLYALTNEHEFLSETHSYPQLQTALNEIPTSPAVAKALRQLGYDVIRKPGHLGSLWDAFVDVMRSLIGAPRKYLPLLETIMRVGADITEVQARRQPEQMRLLSKIEAEPGAEGKPQLVIPGAEQRPAEALQRRAEAPLKPKAPQKPMDVGLFGDEAAQLDLFGRPKRTEMPAIIDAANENISDRLLIRNYPTLSRISGYLGGRRINLKEFRVKAQDQALRLKEIEDQWRRDNPGMALPEAMSAYQAENLFYGRADTRLKRDDRTYVDPLIEAINGLDSPNAYTEAGDYIKAMHAPERNATLRVINPTIPDPSGMSDAQAMAIRAAAAPRQAQFDAVYRAFRSMADHVLDIEVQDGLISQPMAAALRARWPDYAPMRHLEAGERRGLGRGLEVRGPESMRAFGRTSQSENPIAFAIEQMQRAIIRGEKNRVGQAFGRFVQANPDPGLWRFNQGPQIRYLDPRSGIVQTMTDPNFRRRDDVYTYKVNGQEQSVWFVDPDYGTKLARTMKRLGNAELNAFWRFAFGGTRMLARMATSLNMDFFMPNTLRDIGEAFGNLPAEQQRRLTARFGRSLPGAFWASVRGDRAGGYYDRMLREFEEDGGRIGFLGSTRMESIQGNINRKLRRLTQSPFHPARLGGAVLTFVDAANTAMENGTRLAAYTAARESGLTRARSASIGREATVNFNRKGEWGPMISGTYAFANAGIQGQTRMMRALATSKVARRYAYGMAGVGGMLALYGILAGGQDKDGRSKYSKVPEWDRDTNFILMHPDGSGNYWKIPKPFGYGAFASIGDHIISWLYEDETLGKAMTATLANIASSFDPLGRDQNWVAHFTPSTLKPIPHLAMNENWTGRPINPEPMPWNRYLPASSRHFRGTSDFSKEFTRVLNEMSGGDAKTPGYLDVGPGTMDYFMNFIGGGIGRFALNSWNTGARFQKGQEWLPEKTPIIRRFVGAQGTDMANRSLYYDERKEVMAAKQRGKTGPEASAEPAFKAADKARKELLKQIDAIKADRNLSEADKDARVKALQMKELEALLGARQVLERNRARAEGRQPKFAAGGQVKATKASVDYGEGMPARHCGICRYYLGGRCEKVQGVIEPDMWCKLFERGVHLNGMNHKPSEAQKAAGNYAKGSARIHGLDISIENKRGGERSGVSKNGESWSVKMPAHYGYIKGTKGADKDHVDCYLGPHLGSKKVFVVNQHDADSGKFDEHKCMLGFGSKQQALAIYRKGFSDGRGNDRIGSVRELTMDDFKHWLANGNTTRQLAEVA